MTGPRAPSAADLAADAAETIRQLNHHTLHQQALTGPAELDLAVAELAVMSRRLPQLLRQLDRWLHTEQHAGRIRTDDATDPAAVVAHAAADLAHAGRLAHELGHTLDDAHQHLARLGAARPDRPRDSGTASRPAPPSADDWAETVATSGQNHGHQRAGFMTASGQISMSLDNQQLQLADQTPASLRGGTPPTTGQLLVPGPHRRDLHQALPAGPGRVS